MYGTPRQPIPYYSGTRINFVNRKIVIAFPNLVMESSHFVGIKEIAQAGCRYFINLAEDTTIQLNEKVLSNYGAQGGDIDSNVSLQYSLASLQVRAVRYPDGFLTFPLQHGEEGAIVEYPGKPNAVTNNNYLKHKENLYISPLYLSAKDGHKTTIPEAIRKAFSNIERLAEKLHVGNILPNTWTIHRANPSLLTGTAAERRASVGYDSGWVDTDGPISFLDHGSLARIKETFDPNTEIGIIKVSGEVSSSTKDGQGWDFAKIKLKDFKGNTGEFLALSRYILCTDYSGRITEHTVSQLVHFGTEFLAMKTEEQHQNLCKAVDMLVLDMFTAQSFLESHPYKTLKLAPLNRFFPENTKRLGTHLAESLFEIEENKFNDITSYENILTQNIGLQEAHWDSVGKPKLLSRTERGRKFQRALTAAQRKESEVTRLNANLDEQKHRRKVVLENRKVEIEKLNLLKQKLLSLETEVAKWNTELKLADEALERSNKDYQVVLQAAQAAEVTERDILDELGIDKLPNVRQTWLKQNWVVLDLVYRNSIDGKVISIKDKNDISLNATWKLYKIVARTIRPNKIKVGARDPEWETKYGTRVGGPYKFEVTRNISAHDSPIIKVFPAEKSTIFGVEPTQQGRELESKTIKLHPHTGIVNVSGSGLETIFAQSAGVCAGEATIALYQCFQTEDLNLILLTLNSWVTNADPLDQWGREYIYFPKEEEVPCLVHGYSFEYKKHQYINSTNETNHLFYEVAYTDGLPNIQIRFGSMVRHKDSWIIPDNRGKTLLVECPAELASEEASRRISLILKKSYKVLDSTAINETVKIEQALNGQQENNETI